MAEYISLLSDDAAVQMQTVDKYINAVKAKQEKVDPIEALELNDEIAFWEGVKGILAERNGAAAAVTENEMQPVENVAQPVEVVSAHTAEEIADAQAFMAAEQANTVDAYQKYLDDYPNGAYRDGARAGVWKIEGINPESYNDLENARSAAAKVLQDNIAQPVNGDVVAPVADEDVNAVGNADTTVDNQGNPIDANGKLIVDGVTSIDEITDEDFENPTRNVQLPALPENVANAIGTEGRPVVIKKNVFEKNNKTHVELEPENSRDILRSALYNPDIVGSTQPIKRPDYKVAIRTGEKNAIVVLDVYRGKDYVEIVGWRMINEKGLAKMQRQAEREGGQFLILSPNEGSAAALSALPLGQSSASEDTTPTADVQENKQKSGENTQNGSEKDVIEETREQERIAKEREERAGVPPRPSDYSDAISRGNAEAMKAWEEKFNEYAQKLNSDDLPAIEVAIRDMQGLKETIKAGNPKGYKENTNYKAFDYIEKALKKRKKEIKQSSTNGEKQKVVEDSSTEQVTGKLPASEQTKNYGYRIYTDGKRFYLKKPTTPQELAQAVAAQAEENRRKPLRARAQEWQEKLGVQVYVIESVDEVENSAALRAINEGDKVTGWF